MNIRQAASGLFCLLAACGVTSPRTLPAPDTSRGATPDADTAGWRDGTSSLLDTPTATTGGSSFARNPELRLTQEEYTPHALFMDTHGGFVLAMEPWRPDISVSFLNMADTEVKGEPGDFNLRYGKAHAEGKYYVDPDSYLYGGVDYHQRSYQFSSGALGAHDETLYRASATVGFGTFIDKSADSTLFELEFSPGLWTDFSGTTHHDDWQFYSRALITWRYVDGLYLKAGAEYTGVFRHLPVYGLLGLSWVIDPTWRLDVLLPRDIRLTANVSDSTSFYLGLDLDGGVYEIRAPKDSGVNPGISRRVSTQEMNLALGGHHRFGEDFKGLSFFGRVGSALTGDYHFRSNDPAAIYDGSLEMQLFAELGFGWSF